MNETKNKKIEGYKASHVILSIVLGGISILLPVYGITNSKRYLVFQGILILLMQSSTSYNCSILSINYVRYVSNIENYVQIATFYFTIYLNTKKYRQLCLRFY